MTDHHGNNPEPMLLTGPLRESAAIIRLIAMDVDGVLTDGSINLDDNGVETKRFSVRDGLGISVWMRLGFEAAFITRRSGGALNHRARELGVKHIVQGSKDKQAALRDLADATGVRVEEMIFVGDDWPDLSAFKIAGLSAAVADADELVRGRASVVLSRPGGAGAIRELVEELLKAKGMWRQATDLFE